LRHHRNFRSSAGLTAVFSERPALCSLSVRVGPRDVCKIFPILPDYMIGALAAVAWC
jgi:hypothetical protein